METRVLKYFLEVAKQENISKAAMLLHVSQPALSKQIKELEKELNVTLFIRNNKSIHLTEEGYYLQEKAKEIIELNDKIINDFYEGFESLNGTINIGMCESNASKWISEKILDFNKKYPKIKYNIYSANADLIKEKIDRGLIDIGILVGPSFDFSTYESLNIPFKDHWGIIVPKSNKLYNKSFIIKEDLINEKLILSKRSLNISDIKSWLGNKFKEENIIATYNLIQNAIYLVENNMGIAFAVDGAVSLYNDSIKWIPLKPDINLSNVIIWKRNAQKSASINKFIEYICNNL